MKTVTSILTSLAATAVATAGSAAVPTGPEGDAPMRLITPQGVELRADEHVFVLFAALNAAGYSEETKRKGPPLRAPVFHEIRQDVRDALRETRKGKKLSSLDAVRKMFEENPGTINTYLAAVLSRADTGKVDKEAAALASKVDENLSAFREEARLLALFDKVAEEQRGHAKALKAKLERDFVELRGVAGAEDLRAPQNLVVVPNPLDGHAMVRSLDVGDTRYLVVGPGFDTARAAVIEAALEPFISKLVEDAYPRAAAYRRSWDGLRTSRRIRERYADGRSYLTSALTRALAHRVATKVAGVKDTREVDEDFIDEQARQGMRWARVALRLVDRYEGDEPFAEALPKLVTKVTP